MPDPMQGRLIGKNLLITGSAGRIGSAIARAALSEGANVVLADISGDKLKAFTDTLTTTHKARAHPVLADVSTEAGIMALLDQAVIAIGPLTSAVHSAYPISDGWGTPFEKLKASYLCEDLGHQLGGAILFSQHILQHFQTNTY